MKKKEDLLRVAKREKTFSTLAKKEAKGAESRLKKETKKGLRESAKDTRWELSVDKHFANIRSKKAQVAMKKAKGR